jgi:hypothetical protein
MDIAREVGEIMAKELGNDAAWVEGQVSSYKSIALNYL